ELSNLRKDNDVGVLAGEDWIDLARLLEEDLRDQLERLDSDAESRGEEEGVRSCPRPDAPLFVQLHSSVRVPGAWPCSGVISDITSGPALGVSDCFRPSISQLPQRLAFLGIAKALPCGVGVLSKGGLLQLYTTWTSHVGTTLYYATL
ncbi:hypothetical protein FOZ62_020606, partial [Perkinsus olseni]